MKLKIRFFLFALILFSANSYAVNKWSTNYKNYSMIWTTDSLDITHASVTAYDTASIRIQITTSGEWEIFGKDKVGKQMFYLDSSGCLNLGSATSTEPHKLSIFDGGADNEPGFLVLYDDGGGANHLWTDSGNILSGAISAPADDDAGYKIMDFDDGTIGASTQPGTFSTVTAATSITTPSLLSTGDLSVTPTGDDVLIDGGLTVGSATQAGDNNLRVEGTTSLNAATTISVSGSAVGLSVDGNKTTGNLAQFINDDLGTVGDSSVVISKTGQIGIGLAPLGGAIHAYRGAYGLNTSGIAMDADGNSGLAATGDNVIGLIISGATYYRYTSSSFHSNYNGSAGFALSYAASTLSTPTISPFYNDTNSGLGGNGFDYVSLATGAEPNLIVSTNGANVLNASGLASESLNNTSLTTASYKWQETGDFALTGNAATYTHSSGSGILYQDPDSMAVVGVGSRWYKLGYTTSSVTGTITMTLNTSFASESWSLYQTSAGTYTVYFKSAAAPDSFAIAITTTGTATITLDNISLKQVNDGDLYVADDIFADGSINSGAAYNFFADTSAVNDDYGFVTGYVAAYSDGLQLTFKAGVANTGACNLQINALTKLAIKTTGGDDPPDNYIEAGTRVQVIFCDEATDYWQLLSPDANP